MPAWNASAGRTCLCQLTLGANFGLMFYAGSAMAGWNSSCDEDVRAHGNTDTGYCVVCDVRTGSCHPTQPRQ